MAPKKVYEIVEPGKPTWWAANRHKVMFFVGALIMFLIMQGANGGASSSSPSAPAPSSRPSTSHK